jgi:hypothetical protein
MIAALILAQIAPVVAEPKPIAVTIAAIRADPKRFDGRVVRLQGWVNRCQGRDCSIQERAINAPGGPGELLTIADDAKFDAIVGPLLPTFVEFDARLDATCITTMVCLGRSPTLTIVSLRAVVSPEPPMIEGQ